MGFSRWPPVATEEGIDRMNTFLAEHGDLRLLHMNGGVPWPKALVDAVFSSQLQVGWAEARTAIPREHKIFIARFPRTRTGTALIKGTDEDPKLSPPWDEQALDHPDVQTANPSYARRAVETFQPDHLAIGIEVNLALPNDPDP